MRAKTILERKLTTELDIELKDTYLHGTSARETEVLLRVSLLAGQGREDIYQHAGVEHSKVSKQTKAWRRACKVNTPLKVLWG